MTDKTMVYGIKACDTMKKAMTWLTNEGVAFEFHDYKKQGIDAKKLEQWLEAVPWDELINRRGTTWRKLSDEDKQDIDNGKAIALMLANQSLIKRPLLEYQGKVHLGFKPDNYTTIFS
jgi:arsenate reductase